MECLLFAVFVLFSSDRFRVVDGRSSGAPSLACVSMIPGHYGTVTQTSANPYQLSVAGGATGYSAGTPVTVTLSGPSFKGYYVQARHPGMTSPVGTWSGTDPNAKIDACTAPNDVITHANTQSKTSVTLTWNPPSSGTGNVEFWFTVVKEYITYWAKDKAGFVLSGTTPPTPPPTPPTTALPPVAIETTGTQTVTGHYPTAATDTELTTSIPVLAIESTIETQTFTGNYSNDTGTIVSQTTTGKIAVSSNTTDVVLPLTTLGTMNTMNTASACSGGTTTVVFVIMQTYLFVSV